MKQLRKPQLPIFLSLRRPKFAIIFEVLRVLKITQTNFTRILQKTNLDTETTTKYLNFLLHKELVSLSELNNKKQSIKGWYKLTPKGEELYINIGDLLVLLEE